MDPDTILMILAINQISLSPAMTMKIAAATGAIHLRE
jgi:hypothetical protein